jgi:magnesium transporter
MKDINDHVLQVIETIGIFRELAAGMREVYLSSMSNRMNEVMKLLTIVATLFIPLTFVAGIYGMNFKVMPELEWPWGYPVALGVMVLIAAAMILWFRRSKLL